MVSQTVLLLYIQKQKGVFQNMKKQKITNLLLTMALCASAVLSGCAASAASQTEPNQSTTSSTPFEEAKDSGTPISSDEASSVQAYENDEVLSSEEQAKAEQERRAEIAEKCSIYEPYGMTYDTEKDRLFNLKTEFGLRNWCIVHLMLDAGLRSSEVINLRFCDLMFDKNIIQIYKSKGSKTRLVILCPRLKVNLMKYCVIHRKYTALSPMSYVFLQMRQQEAINSNVIKQLFARIKKKSGIDRLHPHLCRHTFATSYIKGGGNIEMLRLLLGHTDYKVTRVYLHLAQQSSLLHEDIYQLDPVFFNRYQ